MRSPFQSFLAVVGLIGCAGVRISQQQLDRPEANIQAAEERGASNVPAARLHLQLARDEAAWAKTLAVAGDDRAEVELERADADAELALELAREASVHDAAVAAGDELRAAVVHGHP